MERLTEAQMNNLKEAEAIYQKDLKDLEIEIRALKSKNEKTSYEEIKYVLQFNLSNWAKKAKASEFFKNY